MANTLFLRLEGPLQSWGERAHWTVRDTAPEPTKSGVIGLLACALGQNSDQALRELSDNIRLGVRCDRPGVPLTDYHTVIGGVLSAQGNVKKTASTGLAETVVSVRHYLCDASFLVAAQADETALIAQLAWAVQHPCWPVYLGRKSCPPSRPLFEGTGDYSSLEAALVAWQPEGAARSAQVRAVLECEPGTGIRRRDAVDVPSRRTFGPRYTRDAQVLVQVRMEED